MFHFVFIDSSSSQSITKHAIFLFYFFKIPQQEMRGLVFLLCCRFPSAECIVCHARCSVSIPLDKCSGFPVGGMSQHGSVDEHSDLRYSLESEQLLDSHFWIARSHTIQYAGVFSQGVKTSYVCESCLCEISFAACVTSDKRNTGKQIRMEPVSDG